MLGVHMHVTHACCDVTRECEKCSKHESERVNNRKGVHAKIVVRVYTRQYIYCQMQFTWNVHVRVRKCASMPSRRDLNLVELWTMFESRSRI